ncbi:MAG: hypothetical protein E7647_06765 [Ruminococcaceae bacterium]|nr:hypothetical protein [Oscillospiraceae bacterium]
MDYTIYGTVVVGDSVISDGAVAVENSKIVYSGKRSGAPVIGETFDYKDALIVPGFIDIHCHAGGKYWCYEDPKAVADHHFAHGTTSMCETLYRDMSIDETVDAIARIREAMVKCKNIIGVHLEGPYLNPKYGASVLDGEVVADPSDYMRLFEDGTVIHVSFAPEVKGTDGLLKVLNEKGIVPAIGHSMASYEDVRRAVEGGVKNVTHLFDATGASISPTRWDGTVEVDFNAAVLLCDGLTYELICDEKGIHVRPEMVRLAAKTVGIDNLIGITDACTGTTDDTDINFLDGELNGSKLTMNRVFRNFVNYGFSIPDAVKFTSTNAARLMGLSDRGSLEAGKLADIAVMDKNYDLIKVYKA